MFIKSIQFYLNFLDKINITSFNDAPRHWQIGFQNPATSVMEGIIELHNDIFFFLIIILILVFYMFFKILIYYNYQFSGIFYNLKNKLYNNSLKNTSSSFAFYINDYILLLIKKNLVSQRITHNALLEIIWVILPAIILILIAIPSFDILYSMDEIFNPDFLVKVIGNQWYWTYEIPEYKISNNKLIESEAFDAIMTAPENIPSNNLLKGMFRLLDTDVWLCLPANTHIQAIVTSEDVIHSWAIPSLGIKIDCVPGRLNQTSLYIKRAGVYYGQCSEICGINHGFMPIKIGAFSSYQWMIKSIEGTTNEWAKIISLLAKKK